MRYALILGMFALLSCSKQIEIEPYSQSDFDCYYHCNYSKYSELLCSETIDSCEVFATINCFFDSNRFSEVVLTCKSKVLYHGKLNDKRFSFKMKYCKKCESDFAFINHETICLRLLDVSERKSFAWYEKQAYFLCDKKNIRIFLFSDGEYRLFEDNWMFRLIFDVL